MPALKDETVAKAKKSPAAEIAPAERPTLIVNGEARIPGWVVDLASFRRWACSDDLPRHGWFSYLGGELWVDLSMEQLFSHNQVKGEFAVVLGSFVKATGIGLFFHDRTLLSHPGADLSTEPDGLFVSYESLTDGRVRLVEGAEEGYVELEGSPDMVLEVVSATSVQKDTVRLPELYWRANIPEYWLVDARAASLQFDILRRGAKGYTATRKQKGWLRSKVFGRSFQLTQQPNRLGLPAYTLAVRE